eukprot:g74183.t1
MHPTSTTNSDTLNECGRPSGLPSAGARGKEGKEEATAVAIETTPPQPGVELDARGDRIVGSWPLTLLKVTAPVVRQANRKAITIFSQQQEAEFGPALCTTPAGAQDEAEVDLNLRQPASSVSSERNMEGMQTVLTKVQRQEPCFRII